jgi:hypothetical protein
VASHQRPAARRTARNLRLQQYRAAPTHAGGSSVPTAPGGRFTISRTIRISAGITPPTCSLMKPGFSKTMTRRQLGRLVSLRTPPSRTRHYGVTYRHERASRFAHLRCSTPEELSRLPRSGHSPPAARGQRPSLIRFTDHLRRLAAKSGHVPLSWTPKSVRLRLRVG